MRHDFVFETARFNLSEVAPHFINPCCFGEDAAAWLRDQLIARGVETSKPDQEDWGWYVVAECQGSSYLIGVGGNAEEAQSDRNQGEWRIILEKRRSLWDELARQGQLSADDPLLAAVESILRQEPDFSNLRYAP